MFPKVIFLFVIIIIASAIHGNCLKLEGRILGGENTRIENHPYIVSVRFANLHFCGGSIVSDRVIVTAAHCIYPSLPPSIHSVQYATSVIGGSKNIIIAERTLRNENYNTTNYNNDIGLIFLVSKIPFNAGANLIQLATSAPAAGVSAVILGWGSLYENGPNAYILQKAVVVTIARSVCQKHYKGINKITSKMLCAGVDKGGVDACKFDSGGPLVIGEQLAGIISEGYGCGNPNYPGIYSNVAELKNWIDENIDKHKYKRQINSPRSRFH